MKRVFEGATLVSVILLILTAACAFIFNVNNQKNKHKEQRRSARHIEKEAKRKDSQYSKKIHQTEREKGKAQDELDEYKKLRDPLWNYYDPEDEDFKTLPGKYGVDEPPPRPEDY